MMVAFLLFAGLLPLIAGGQVASAAPAVIYVPDDYTTIQEAINAAEPGDTVLVEPGTYEEGITIGKSLTLLGAQADVPIVDGKRAGDESIIRGRVYPWSGKPRTSKVVYIYHSDVVVNGFTIERAKTMNICIRGWLEGISNVRISYCHIQGNNKWGIHRSTSAANVTIDHNYITSNMWGVLTNGGSTTITNNTFYGNVIGIDFNGGDPYDRYFPDYAEPKYPTIIGNNTFTDDSISINLRLDKCHQSISVRGNDIREARSAAIKTWGHGVDIVSPAIHHNNMWNNEFGINNPVADINLSAENNWWGTTVESEIASMVSGNVDYSFWLDAPYSEGNGDLPQSEPVLDPMFLMFLSIVLMAIALTLDSTTFAFFGGISATFVGLSNLGTMWVAMVFIGLGIYFVLAAVFIEWGE